MKLPVQIRRDPTSATVSAVMIESHDSSELLNLLARLGVEPLPRVYACSRGYLLLLDNPISSAPSGTVALQSVNDRVYHPTDSTLNPPISDSESDRIASGKRFLILPFGHAEHF
ncbi:MAG: hypothetical protein ACYTDT_11205, partial [Planctomycetota bacterium]